MAIAAEAVVVVVLMFLVALVREDQCPESGAIHLINLNCPLTGQSGDNCKLMEVKRRKQVNGSQAPASKLMEAKRRKQMESMPRPQVNGSQSPEAI